MTITAAAMAVLVGHPWPGNLRELKNVMEFVAAAHEGTVVEPQHLAARVAGTPPDRQTEAQAVSPAAGAGDFRPIQDEIRELEIARMKAALIAAGGHRARAASLIQMPIRTFRLKMKRYRLRRSEGDTDG